jgi:hypothetical protein
MILTQSEVNNLFYYCEFGGHGWLLNIIIENFPTTSVVLNCPASRTTYRERTEQKTCVFNPLCYFVFFFGTALSPIRERYKNKCV